MVRNEKGNAMIFSVIALAVIFIVTLAFVFMSSSNSKHAHKEETKTQAYYVAKTGVESVLKHLEKKADDTGDMRDDIVELIKQTDLGNKGEGTYKNGKFEIEVKKETRPDKSGIDRTVYLITSKGEVKEGKDQITAVVTPEYKVESGWGTGTIDAGGRDTVFIEGLHNLEGGGMILNVDKERKVGKGGPIHIKLGHNGEDILALFEEYSERVGNYYLDRTVDGSNVTSEKLLNDKLPDMEPVELYYGLQREKPSLSFPSSYGSSVVGSNLKIDVSNPNPSVGQLVSEEYQVINQDSSGLYTKEIKNKEFLKISASEFILDGKNEFITSSSRDIVIYTKKFFLDGNSTINVKGPGNVYIFVDGSADIHERSTFGAELDDPDYESTDTNINLYVKEGTKFEMEDNSKVNNFFLYGPDSRIQLEGGTEFTGRMTVDTVDFNGKTTIKSPNSGTPNEESDPIIGFKTIEWER